MYNRFLTLLYRDYERFQLQLTRLALLERISRTDSVPLEQLIKRLPLLKYQYFASFPTYYVRILPNATSAIIKTQNNNMPDKHWIMTVK